MRKYSKIYPEIWIGDTGREIKKHGIETQLLTQYLISSPHATMIGIYYLPISFIAHETGMQIKAITKAMHNLITLEFCSYDENKEYIWVRNMASFQISESLKEKDNLVVNVNSYFKNLPMLEFLAEFYEKYKIAFHLVKREDVKSGFEGASKTLRSQEKEKEIDQDKEQERKQVSGAAESKIDSALIVIDTPDSVLSTIKKKELDNAAEHVEAISIPLKNGLEFSISTTLVDKWKATFPNVNIIQVLRVIKEWNMANPKKRKMESGILRHITLWLAREQEKHKNGIGSARVNNANGLFNFNQSIADEWLQKNSIIDVGEVH